MGQEFSPTLCAHSFASINNIHFGDSLDGLTALYPVDQGKEIFGAGCGEVSVDVIHNHNMYGGNPRVMNNKDFIVQKAYSESVGCQPSGLYPHLRISRISRNMTEIIPRQW